MTAELNSPEPQPEDQPESSPAPDGPPPQLRFNWWLILIAVLVFAAWLSVFMLRSREKLGELPGGKPVADSSAADPEVPTELEAVDADATARFWEQVEARKPQYQEVQRSCPGCDTKITPLTGVAQQDNRFGGVATDLMKLALSPPALEHAPPVLDRQNFDLLLETCPTCHATFFDIDLINLSSGLVKAGLSKLKGFNGSQLAPAMAKRDEGKLTLDEQHLLRYLTHREAGFPPEERGYAALAGAYSSNLSTYLGREYRIPAAAFYALAAAELEAYLDAGEYENDQAASTVAMTLGELNRLLGRQESATAAFAQARSLKGLDERTLKIVDYLEGLNAAGDYGLQLAPIEGFEPPPIGWYIERMLPAINAELEYERGNWNELGSPDEIVAQMLERSDPG